MKSNILYILILFVAISCQNDSQKDNKKELPKIAIAGIAIESSTFAPAQ